MKKKFWYLLIFFMTFQSHCSICNILKNLYNDTDFAAKFASALVFTAGISSAEEQYIIENFCTDRKTCSNSQRLGLPYSMSEHNNIISINLAPVCESQNEFTEENFNSTKFCAIYYLYKLMHSFITYKIVKTVLDKS